ncbi:MAG: hypothetical protein M3Q07_01445 [Pseudobdellovibrionaceae bacterium]|nr:hypothetical protein [Pseudobdellovibrionaceae bacterium]
MSAYRILVALALFIAPISGYSSSANQCLVNKSDQSALSDDEKKQLRDCFKSNDCTAAEAEKICPWAQEAKSGSTGDMSPEQKKELELVCEQCDQIAIIVCGHDFDAAQLRFNIFHKIFISDENKDKPMVFEFANPNFKFSNLNVSDNIAQIEADRRTYQAEYDKLLSDLAKLSVTVATESAVTANIKTANNLISSFEKKWTLYFINIDKLKDLFSRADTILIDWHFRLLAMKSESGCSGFVPQISLAAKDSGSLSAAFAKALAVINKSNTKYNLGPLNQFTENAIKLKYVQTSKTTLDELEKSIGSVLKLDSDLMEANTWWYNTSIGGLVSGLHTRYYQYREPLRRLTMAVAEGQRYLDLLKANKGVPQASLTRAITTQEQRIKVINDDIAWLTKRGWKGQFTDQKENASSWLQTAKSTVCKNALKSYQDGASKVTDDVRDFESFAEQQYLNAIKVCGAVE